MPEWILQELEILAQALAALVLGGLVGWERESQSKWAGLRTHMLVCLASFLFVKLSFMLVGSARDSPVFLGEMIQSDPVRIIEAIVTGLAFLGAGTIFRDQEKNWARGLTTAASLLAVAPVGIAVALERYVLATGISLLVLLILRVFGSLEKKVFE
ncbi:MAG: MgtC/SapB family protein [Verrucomicrobiota bacterium JB023]|nr:MgtC/SapB family protein [Verrucomicrobiota bacterium JB023]